LKPFFIQYKERSRYKIRKKPTPGKLENHHQLIEFDWISFGQTVSLSPKGKKLWFPCILMLIVLTLFWTPLITS